MNSRDDKPSGSSVNDYGSVRGGDGGDQRRMGEVIVPRTAVGVSIGKSGNKNAEKKVDELGKKVDELGKKMDEFGALLRNLYSVVEYHSRILNIVPMPVAQTPKVAEQEDGRRDGLGKVLRGHSIVEHFVRNDTPMDVIEEGEEERNEYGTGGGSGGGGGRPMGMSMGSPGGMQMNSGQGGKMLTVEMMIPGTKCGLVIGKDGETIKQLQERAGVKMVMIQENNQVSPLGKPLRIIGDAEKVEYAKRLIEEIMNSRDDKPSGSSVNEYRSGGGGDGGGQRSISEVVVPRTAVGVSIGKSGEAIKRLTVESGAKIPLKQDDFNAPERTALIIDAKRLIEENTNSRDDKPSESSVNEYGSGRGGDGGGQRSMGEVVVPRTAVGVSIGKSGEAIKRLTVESGAKIPFKQDDFNAPERTLGLIDLRRLIEEIMNSRDDKPSGSSVNEYGSGRGGDGGGQRSMGEVVVPRTAVGVSIGKSGEAIKRLTTESGAKIPLKQDDFNAPERTALIIDAKRLIEENTSSRDDKPSGSSVNEYGSGRGFDGGGQRSMGEVIVPRTAVGVRIGKSGEAIKRLTVESGAKIPFKQDDFNAPERTALIIGTPEQITRATEIITDLVNGAMVNDSMTPTYSQYSQNNDVDVFMHVPAKKTGLIIGKGDETVKQISAESGVHVELSGEPPAPSERENVFWNFFRFLCVKK